MDDLWYLQAASYWYNGRHEWAVEKKKEKMDRLKKMVRRDLDVEAQGSKRGNAAEALDTDLK